MPVHCAKQHTEAKKKDIKNYMPFWKRPNYRDREKVSAYPGGVPGGRVGGEGKGEVGHRTFLGP